MKTPNDYSKHLVSPELYKLATERLAQAAGSNPPPALTQLMRELPANEIHATLEAVDKDNSDEQ